MFTIAMTIPSLHRSCLTECPGGRDSGAAPISGSESFGPTRTPFLAGPFRTFQLDSFRSFGGNNEPLTRSLTHIFSPDVIAIVTFFVRWSSRPSSVDGFFASGPIPSLTQLSLLKCRRRFDRPSTYFAAMHSLSSIFSECHFSRGAAWRVLLEREGLSRSNASEQALFNRVVAWRRDNSSGG